MNLDPIAGWLQSLWWERHYDSITYDTCFSLALLMMTASGLLLLFDACIRFHAQPIKLVSC